jgi:hypothetical protein
MSARCAYIHEHDDQDRHARALRRHPPLSHSGPALARWKDKADSEMIIGVLRKVIKMIYDDAGSEGTARAVPWMLIIGRGIATVLFKQFLEAFLVIEV